MNLGFYYHVPCRVEGGRITTAGPLGCFLEVLARRVEKLILFAHEADKQDTVIDYSLGGNNIVFVSLGPKPHAVRRSFLGRSLLSSISAKVSECDMMLVRGPTHLMHAWGAVCRKIEVRLVPLLVGDYRAANANLDMVFPKGQLVRFLNWIVDFQERRLFRNQKVIVNSFELYQKYQKIASVVYEINTTTLSKHSFYSRFDTCSGDAVNLLYSGRFDWQKGLQELMDAFVYLVTKKNQNLILNFVGWQDSGGESIEENLRTQAKQLGLSNRVQFHGKKRVGFELDAMYRQSDIFIIPSYAEGFPRAIWEAMANSCPVIASRVGGIPRNLLTEEHALLVNPRDAEAIADAILTLVDNSRLRKKVIKNGYELARTKTLEIQVGKLSHILGTFDSA